jgi:cytochrome c-type biogenesis protein CcmH/NrfG
LNKNAIVPLLIGVLLGGIIGYSIGTSMSEHDHGPTVAAPAGPAPGGGAPAGMPGGGGAGLEAQQRIAALQQIVQRDPKNVQAWTQLGNDYFDTQQPQKAIEAYERALELQPGNPDVLTDQGVMYRAIGQFDRAVQNFQKANQANPQHMQSLFNMGIVYAYDLKQPDKAIAAWNKVVQTSPSSPQAVQARTHIEQVKAGAAK